jgi:hypothetical protein
LYYFLCPPSFILSFLFQFFNLFCLTVSPLRSWSNFPSLSYLLRPAFSVHSLLIVFCSIVSSFFFEIPCVLLNFSPFY